VDTNFIFCPYFLFLFLKLNVKREIVNSTEENNHQWKRSMNKRWVFVVKRIAWNTFENSFHKHYYCFCLPRGSQCLILYIVVAKRKKCIYVLVARWGFSFKLHCFGISALTKKSLKKKSRQVRLAFLFSCPFPAFFKTIFLWFDFCWLIADQGIKIQKITKAKKAGLSKATNTTNEQKKPQLNKRKGILIKATSTPGQKTQKQQKQILLQILPQSHRQSYQFSERQANFLKENQNSNQNPLLTSLSYILQCF
jgi:hypothetical protein